MSAPSSDRAGIRQAIRALKASDFRLASVWDGEEDSPVKSEAEAIDLIMNLDQAHLYVEDPEGHSGWVFFVLGNDPEEVINDHTVNLSPALDPLYERWSA